MKLSRKTPFAVSGLSLLVAFTLSLGAGMMSFPDAADAAWSCVPYARQVSAVNLKGDAWRWWDAATGVYAKGHVPKPGSVLVFKRTGDMRRGHVAVVRQVVNSRKIIVDHANWSRKGGIDRGVAIIDVSAHNDWSKTRVWFMPIHDFGDGSHPTYGFIYAPSRATVLAAVDVSEENGIVEDDNPDYAPPAHTTASLIQASYEPPTDGSVPVAKVTAYTPVSVAGLEDAADEQSTGYARHKIAPAKGVPLPDRRPVMVTALLSEVIALIGHDASLNAAPLPAPKPGSQL